MAYPFLLWIHFKCHPALGKDYSYIAIFIVLIYKIFALNFTAFDLAVALMEKDEKCEVITDARYAYGSMGR